MRGTNVRAMSTLAEQAKISGAARADLQPVDTEAAARRALFVAVAVLLLIIGWGKLELNLRWIHLSVGGSAEGAFRLLTVAYLAARLYARSIRLSFDWLRDPFVALFVVAALSPIWNVHHDTHQILGTVLPALMSYLAVRWIMREGFEPYGPGLLRCWTVSLTLVSAQILVYTPRVLLTFEQTDSLFEHHTHVAMRMALALPLTVGLMLVDLGRTAQRSNPSTSGGRRRTLVRVGYPLLLVLQVIGITVAGSRIGWLALGAVALYGMLAGSSPRMRRIYLIAVLGVVTLSLAFPKVRTNFSTLLHLTQEDNFKRRIVIYTTDLTLIEQHPLLGLGFSSTTFTQSGQALVGHDFQYLHPHDLFLQVPVYLGIPGVICFVWLLVALYRAMHALGRAAPSVYTPILAGMRGSLVGLVVMNIAETALSSERIAYMAPVLLAVIFSWAQALHADPTAPREP